MILNAYAVLDAFVSLLRLGLGFFVLWFGLVAWRSWKRHTIGSETGAKLEDRFHLLLLLAGVLLVLNVASWPIFYLLLQSYVPEWPGVMCIYGVTRIGTGSLGTSRFLPPLVTAIQAMKPALVFLSGAWFVLHVINRRTRTAPLTGRILVVLLMSGVVAIADAAAEVTYLTIPKKEEFLSAGCCTGTFVEESRTSRFLPAIRVGESAIPWLYAAYYTVNAGTMLVLAVALRRDARRFAVAPLALAASLSLAVNALFLVEAAAPRLLHLPDHHCVYDLVPRAPESLVGAALFVGASFSIGWACVAGWLGTGESVVPFRPQTIRRLLYSGLLGYLGSVIVLSVELALA